MTQEYELDLFPSDQLKAIIRAFANPSEGDPYEDTDDSDFDDDDEDFDDHLPVGTDNDDESSA